jgi:hypothetical protein
MICEPCQHQPPGTGENWQTIPPTDRNTFVSVWTLDGTGIPDRPRPREVRDR